MSYLKESNSAIALAKDMELTHVGGGFYSNKSGVVTHKSSDGVTLKSVSKSQLNKTKTVANKIAVQKDETMPDPLGKPSGISNNKILPKKKKKSLVEFLSENKQPTWLVKYQIHSTGSRIHEFYIDALNQKEALAKANTFLHDAKFIFSPIRTNKNHK
jgi:hypothetical protein